MRGELGGVPALARTLIGLRTRVLDPSSSYARCTSTGIFGGIDRVGILRNRPQYQPTRSISTGLRKQYGPCSASHSLWQSQRRTTGLKSKERRNPLTEWLYTSISASRHYSGKPGGNDFGAMTEDEYSKSEKRFRPLTYAEISKIFGPGLTQKQGNHLLDTLQKQRVTGTLDHDVVGPGINMARISRALNWLRERYPLDEDAAIMARIEREEQVINEWRPQDGMQGLRDLKDVYGESQLEKRIAEVKLVRERQAKELEEEQEQRRRKQMEEINNNSSQGPRELARHGGSQVGKHTGGGGETAEWVRRYRERAKLSDMEETPDTPAIKVLGPTTMFGLALIVACYWFASEYVPPPASSRLFPEIPPAAATVGGVVALNVAVWIMWRFPPLWRFMNRNFLLVTATPNPLAMLGSVFSHQGIGHLAGNMAGLWFIGTALCDEVGRGKFLALYCAGGVIGAWLSMVRFVAMRQLQYTTLGASGAVLAVIATFCALYPNKHITIAFLPEDWRRFLAVRAEHALYLLLAIEVISILRGKIGRVDHAAHLGGILSGIGTAELLRRQARARRRLLEQQRQNGLRIVR